MSIDRCMCGTAVDTDSEPDAYEYGPCLCMDCREREERFRDAQYAERQRLEEASRSDADPGL